MPLQRPQKTVIPVGAGVVLRGHRTQLLKQYSGKLGLHDKNTGRCLYSMKNPIIYTLLLLSMQGAVCFAQGNPVNPAQQAPVPAYKQDIRILRTHTANQPFDMAAKLQWNPHAQHWDKVLVIYNGAAEPVAEHPVWKYLDSLRDPGRPPQKKGENLHYRTFYLKAMCGDTTPIMAGKAMYIDFNRNSLGRYSEEDYLRDWHCPDWAMGRENALVVSGVEARDGKQSLRLHFPKYRAGCTSAPGCYNWKPKLGIGLESIYYSYWVKFPENFDFVFGGKLPGIGSDNGGTGGYKPDGKNGWSVRAMWEGHGELGQYVYHIDQADYFGDFFAWDTPPIEKGKWYHIKTFVRLNTPGQKNGMIRTWLNNRQVLNRQDLRFRYVPELKIERFLFSAFFGGTGAKWAPKQDMMLYLDDFIISAGKI